MGYASADSAGFDGVWKIQALCDLGDRAAVTVLVSSIYFVTIQADGKSPARALMLYPANVDYNKAADRAIDKMPQASQGD